MRTIPKLLSILCVFLCGCGSFSGNESSMDSQFTPLVSSISPSDGVSSVSTDTTIAVTFSEEMNSSTISTNISDTSCSGTFQISSDDFSSCIQISSSPIASNSNKTFTIIPSSRLSYGTIYKVRLSENITDKNSRNIENKYTTPSGFTSINISVESTSPSDSEISVSLDSSVSITFNEPVDPSTVTTNTSNTSCSGTFQLSSDNFSTCVQISSSPSASNSNKTFTVTPNSKLLSQTAYKIRLTTGIKDNSDNTLIKQFDSKNGFTTFGMFVAISTKGDYAHILNSSDGISWESRNSQKYYGVTYGKEVFVVTGIGRENYTSSDGISWISGNSGTFFSKYGITFGNDIFMTISSYDGTISTSTNGFTWNATAFTNLSAAEEINFANGIFFVMKYSYFYTSLDGKSWKYSSTDTTKRLKEVTFGNNLFVSVGFDGTIITSSDGSLWTSRTSGTTEHLYGAIYWENIFIVVGASGTILTSSNGISWSSKNSGTTNYLYGVTVGKDLIVAVGSSGTILTSKDGTNWIQRSSGIDGYITEVKYSN